LRRDWRVATFPCACRLFTPSRIRSNSVSASSTRRGLVLRLTTTSPPRTRDTSTTSLYTANRLRAYSRSATSERAEPNRHRRVYTRNRPQQIEVVEFESLAAANGFGEETARLSRRYGFRVHARPALGKTVFPCRCFHPAPPPPPSHASSSSSSSASS